MSFNRLKFWRSVKLIRRPNQIRIWSSSIEFQKLVLTSHQKIISCPTQLIENEMRRCQKKTYLIILRNIALKWVKSYQTIFRDDVSMSAWINSRRTFVKYERWCSSDSEHSYRRSQHYFQGLKYQTKAIYYWFNESKPLSKN